MGPSFDRWLRRLGWTLLAASPAVPVWLWPATAAGHGRIGIGLKITALAAPPVLGLAFLALSLSRRCRRMADEAARFRAEYAARLEADVALRTRELRDLNESLARMNRDKERVFGIIGHDLRNPAQSLFGLARLFSSDPGILSPQELASLAKKIEESCQTQLVLLDNLLLWGRAHLGGMSSRAEPQAAVDIIQAAVSALEPAALAKGILLESGPGPELIVQADPQAAQAVLRNLLDNALKFTPSGGRVTVSAAPKGEWIELSVRDTGTGMSPKRLGELFAGPVDSRSGTRAEKGAGVGLTLCRDLARANSGDLRIESEPGRGTLATLILPSAPPPA